MNVDTPLVGSESEGGEGTILAEDLELVDDLVSSVVTGTGETLGVLVGHHGACVSMVSRGFEILPRKLSQSGRGGEELFSPLAWNKYADQYVDKESA